MPKHPGTLGECQNSFIIPVALRRGTWKPRENICGDVAELLMNSLSELPLSDCVFNCENYLHYHVRHLKRKMCRILCCCSLVKKMRRLFACSVTNDIVLGTQIGNVGSKHVDVANLPRARNGVTDCQYGRPNRYLRNASVKVSLKVRTCRLLVMMAPDCLPNCKLSQPSTFCRSISSFQT